MRVQVCKVRVYGSPEPEHRSYLDATDEIFALPSNVLKISLGRVRRLSWPEQCTKEDLTDFLARVRALATQI